MGNYPEKTIEDRQKEFSKYQKELESRELALKNKQAGAEIEKFERERIRKKLLSIKYRIIRYNNEVISIVENVIDNIDKSYQKEKTFNNKLNPSELFQSQQIIDNYKSIKIDFKNCLKNKGSKIEVLFPNRKIDISSKRYFIYSLQATVKEFFDIMDYLRRYD